MSVSDLQIDQANQTAFERMRGVYPVWVALESASHALNLGNHTLLHAGPPLSDPSRIPAAIRSSMVLCCLYEGWAEDEAQAERLISSGQLKLLPAQDHACVTPLAAVISPSSTLVKVVDAASGIGPVWSLLASGPAPDIRFGSRDPGCLKTMAYRDGELRSLLSKALSTPVDLVEIANRALAAGDELHSRTQSATAALRDVLLERLTAAAVDQTSLGALAQMMNAAPGFFLTLWMAACRLTLSACEGIAHCSLVSRIGGNGEAFGLSTGARPDEWITVPAEPPVGSYFPHHASDLMPSGVVGDSAVVDAMGFGGQLVDNAPDVLASLKSYLPSSYQNTSAQLMWAENSAYRCHVPVRSGLDVRRVVSSDVSPLVNIGILADDGVNGLLGRGVYVAPQSVFASALD